MVAFVTGATGFIGFHLVRRLLAEGWDVRCLIRHPDTRGNLIAELSAGYSEKFTLIPGDLNDSDALETGTRDVDVVFHLAGTVIAVNKIGYFRTNFDGTVNLVNVLVDHGTPPPRLVFASSLAAGGPNPPGQPRSEGDPDRPITHYGRSKLAAEEYIQEHKDRLWSTILRPASVYGPRDVGFASIFRLVSRGLRLGYIGKDSELSFIYVENLVQALMSIAQTTAPSGEVYYAANPPIMTLNGFQQAIAAALGRKTFRLPIPRFLLLLSALVATGVQKVTRRPSFFNLQKAIEAVQPAWSCTASKLWETLGTAPPIGLRETLHRTIEAYRENGVL